MTEGTWTEEELEMLRAELDTYEAELRERGLKRNTITTYVQPVERFLNWLGGTYRPRRAVATPPPDTGAPVSEVAQGRGSRYAGLQAYLAGRPEPVVRLSFADIERIIGGTLPASARKYRPWWANEEGGTHIHARAWLDAGRRTAKVDMNGQTVDFVVEVR